MNPQAVYSSKLLDVAIIDDEEQLRLFEKSLELAEEGAFNDDNLRGHCITNTVVNEFVIVTKKLKQMNKILIDQLESYSEFNKIFATMKTNEIAIKSLEGKMIDNVAIHDGINTLLNGIEQKEKRLKELNEQLSDQLEKSADLDGIVATLKTNEIAIKSLDGKMIENMDMHDGIIRLLNGIEQKAKKLKQLDQQLDEQVSKHVVDQSESAILSESISADRENVEDDQDILDIHDDADSITFDTVYVNCKIEGGIKDEPVGIEAESGGVGNNFSTSHTKPYVCKHEGCPVSSNDCSNLRRHQDACKFNPSNSKKVAAKMKAKDEQPYTKLGNGRYECKKCKKDYADSWGVTRHYSIDHGPKPSESTPKPKKKEKINTERNRKKNLNA